MPVAKFKDIRERFIKLKGFFNFSDVMQAIRKWYADNYFLFDEPTHEWEGAADGVKAKIKIKGVRKINEYVKYHVFVNVRVWEMKEVEMIKDGQKVITNEGRIAIETSGKVEFDWQNRFGGSKFFQNMQDFFHKFIIRQDIDEVWEDGLMAKVTEFTKLIKDKLGQGT